MASASALGRPTKSWEHNQAPSILDGTDSSAKLRKAQVVLHIKEMARLVEQLDGLMNPGRSPSPRETLIRCWNEVLAVLSVEGKAEVLLPVVELQGVLANFRETRKETLKTINTLQGCPSVAPSGPGFVHHTSATTHTDKNGKDLMEEASDEDLLDLFRSELGKRGPDNIEDAQSKPPSLRTPALPCKMPSMPGKY